jgi:hypothetical protein
MTNYSSSDDGASKRATDAIAETFKSSGAHWATEARLANARARIYFALFLFFVSVLVLMLGLSEQSSQPVDAAVIKLLSTIPFFGGGWYLTLGHRALRDHARALQARADDFARKAALGSAARVL